MRAVLIAVAALLLAVPEAEARKPQSMIFEATRELRSHDGAVRAATFDEIRRFGVRWIRVVMYWRDVAPSPGSASAPQFDETNPAAYDWTLYERIVDEARARGIRVLVTPSGPAPDWATLVGNGVDYPSPTRFQRFMTAVGRRFGSRVSHWSIWNEPNHPQFPTGGPRVHDHSSRRAPGRARADPRARERARARRGAHRGAGRIDSAAGDARPGRSSQ